jgi:hypothetical protein
MNASSHIQPRRKMAKVKTTSTHQVNVSCHQRAGAGRLGLGGALLALRFSVDEGGTGSGTLDSLEPRAMKIHRSEGGGILASFVLVQPPRFDGSAAHFPGGCGRTVGRRGLARHTLARSPAVCRHA